MQLVPMVVEREGSNERSYDIYSRLVKDRIVFLGGAVMEQTANIICATLLYLDSISNAPINFFINSPGGLVTYGLAIYDTMRFVKSPIHTTVLGQAASMGSLLACAGDKRFILPSAKHLIHQPSGGTQGQATDIRIQAEEILRLKKYLTEIYVKHTKQPFEKLERDLERDFIMDAQESVAYGLADEIIISPPKSKE